VSKRLFDLVAASLGLVVLSPFFLIAAVLVRCSGRGPVIYRSVRVGRDGVPFTLLKFRTMRFDRFDEGLRITSAGDPRITTAGRWLRRWKLDELPQLLNVLKGEMSIVGPRPEDPKYVAGYSDAHRRVLSMRPGLAGPAVLAFRHEEDQLAASPNPEKLYLEEILPRKLNLDLEYVNHNSVLGDVKVLMRTLRALFTGPPKPFN
jgi:lipopolysaccharide/colanic/teichoic acid biosynthesis glycosyltransferase